ncbi:MAG: hypothetical protein EOP06_09250 [Proteobacteria bacterium]|nr:MAG: hypothetical protein EOP06_09250 [Pseudomonadota bacterium]
MKITPIIWTALIGVIFADEDKLAIRPYIEFYKIGKEFHRMEKYKEHRDSDLSKAYRSAFGDIRFESVTITLVDFNTGQRALEFVPSASVPVILPDRDSQNPGNLVSFFSEVFPEKTRPFLTPDYDTGAIYEFKSKTMEVAVFVPYQIDWPEFYLVKVKRNADNAIIKF